MPYDPNPKVDKASLDAQQRVRVYWMTLVSGAANVLALVLHLQSIDDFALRGPLVGAVAGAIILAGIRGNTDGYYQQLVNIGVRWTMIALGIAVLVLWAHRETSLVGRLLPGIERLAADPYLLALLLGVIFHAGYAFAYVRDLASDAGDS
ncbi:hypothetical protein WAB17_12335 [Parerythrobacter aurantius]|uniref:hypothetical protein n=1 Tax=Parerythrobacter aurantius TaxID=3127706 RepID=UPI00325635B7